MMEHQSQSKSHAFNIALCMQSMCQLPTIPYDAKQVPHAIKSTTFDAIFSLEQNQKAKTIVKFQVSTNNNNNKHAGEEK